MSTRRGGKRAVLLCGALIACGGCAIVPFHHRAVIPPAPPVMEGPPDSLAFVQPAPPDTLERVARTTPPHPRPHPVKVPAPVDTTQRSESPYPPPPPAQVTQDRSISIDMPEALRTQLEGTYQIDIVSVQKTVTLLGERQLTDDESDKLQNVTGLVSQAKAAFDQEDLQAAANLAHKARVLADEIASHPH